MLLVQNLQVSAAEEADLQLLKHSQRALAGSEKPDPAIGRPTLLSIFSKFNKIE